MRELNVDEANAISGGACVEPELVGLCLLVGAVATVALYCWLTKT